MYGYDIYNNHDSYDTCTNVTVDNVFICVDDNIFVILNK